MLYNAASFNTVLSVDAPETIDSLPILASDFTQSQTKTHRSSGSFSISLISSIAMWCLPWKQNAFVLTPADDHFHNRLWLFITSWIAAEFHKAM